CLKRNDADDEGSLGLVAVDFKAGLALLPFLPMSAGDFKLIGAGIGRGSLVQFDRGDIRKLDSFVNSHSDKFSDMQGMLQELKESETAYRNSVPDITHNHIRLLYSGRLWSTIRKSSITGWQVRNLIDEKTAESLKGCWGKSTVFLLLGFVPFLGKILRRLWGRPDWRNHYVNMLRSPDYLGRSFRGRIAEKLIGWHRAGRLDEQRAVRLYDQRWRFFCHLPLSILPSVLHRFLTDWSFFKEKLYYITVRPVRLYFDSKLREQWLRDMVAEGGKKHILSSEDSQIILSHINEPFIQKYLKSLAVHVCTLPVTQIVSVAIALIYVLTHPEMPRKQAWGIGVGIIALFQVVPISPGSLTRGLYVLYLVIRERNFKDYNIAVFLGFFKYVGYLAFPIQMTYRYPALARFMAAHWATEAVHIVPVFGEHGALLEHWVFGLFYNWPLTIRRRMRRRAEKRLEQKGRYWHIILCAIGAAGLFGLADYVYLNRMSEMPTLKDIWPVAMFLPLLSGLIVTLCCGGARLWKRLVSGTICGILSGVFYSVFTALIGSGHVGIEVGLLAKNCVWRVFVFAILATIGVLVTELKLPEGD
ncbi:MAG: hypothetical protein ACYSWP_17150, partial [Planctomycetota bacterium]